MRDMKRAVARRPSTSDDDDIRMGKNAFVFLLGAGASVDAGIPTSKQLLRMALDRIKDADLLRLGKNSEDVEDLLAILAEVASADQSPLFRLVRKWRVPVDDATFRQKARRRLLIVRKFVVERLKPNRDVAYLAGLSGFSSRTNPRSRRKTEVFSLNYDCALESACFEAGVPCWTGYEKYLDPEGNYPFAFFTPRLLDRPGINLHKLHGSMNWGSVRLPNHTEPVYEVVRRTKNLSDEECRRQHGFRIDPWGPHKGIILGERDKGHAYEPYDELRRRFRFSLTQALALIAVGYSWNDAYINLMIRRACAIAREGELPLIVIDVNPDSLRAASTDRRGTPNMYLFSTARSALAGGTVKFGIRVDYGLLRGTATGGLIGALQSRSRFRMD